jgi:hypothetical protein
LRLPCLRYYQLKIKLVADEPLEIRIPVWESIRPQKGHAWFAYLVSGFWAGATSIVVIFLLHFLTPKKMVSAGRATR